MKPSLSKPIDILQHYWGHSSFRSVQQDAINAVLEGRDTLLIMPTGGGKSVCFQVPAMLKPGICIVVSPLVALIQDQVDQLKAKGIKSIALSSGLRFDEVDQLLDNCIYGDYKFLYLSPERLQQPLVQERIRSMPVNLIVLDEAHCISQWGHDFRPAYRNCRVLRNLHPGTSVIALTATATPKVQQDICENLALEHPMILRTSVHRPNLAYWVLEEEDKLHRIQRILAKNQGASIIYVRNRKATLTISKQLQERGISATHYHGGMEKKEKEQQLQLWMNNKVQVMVATNAFGMGIDKADVRSVIHLGLPDTLEGYYQEAGRAGRDGQKAHAILLKGSGDHQTLKKQFIEVIPDSDYLKFLYRKLNNYLQIPYGEGELQKFPLNFNHFCKTYDLHPVLSFNALKALERHSILQFEETFQKLTYLKIKASPGQFSKAIGRSERMELCMQALLRTYGGLFEVSTRINPSIIASKTGFDEEMVWKQLRLLHEEGIVQLEENNTDSLLSFLVPREDDRAINRIAKDVNTYKDSRAVLTEKVLRYTENDDKCKSMQLQEYFGESDTSPCGICSVCHQKSQKKSGGVSSSLLSAILKELSKETLSSRALAEKLPFEEDEILDALKFLLNENKIKINHNNQFYLR